MYIGSGAVTLGFKLQSLSKMLPSRDCWKAGAGAKRMSMKHFCLELRLSNKSSSGSTLLIVHNLLARLLVAKKAMSLIDSCKI